MYRPPMLANAGVSKRISWSGKIKKAYKSSFHMPKNCKTAKVVIPAAAFGMAILKKEVKNPAPSILAASKIVSGTALNVDLRKKTPKGIFVPM